MWVPAPGLLLAGVACVQLRHRQCEHGRYREYEQQEVLSLDSLGAMEGIKCNVFDRISGKVATSPLPVPQVSLK